MVLQGVKPGTTPQWLLLALNLKLTEHSSNLPPLKEPWNTQQIPSHLVTKDSYVKWQWPAAVRQQPCSTHTMSDVQQARQRPSKKAQVAVSARMRNN
jgi:hypothetical protein